MPEAWTGRLIGKMHNNDISYEDVAKKLGYGKPYICLMHLFADRAKGAFFWHGRPRKSKVNQDAVRLHRHCVV